MDIFVFAGYRNLVDYVVVNANLVVSAKLASWLAAVGILWSVRDTLKGRIACSLSAVASPSGIVSIIHDWFEQMVPLTL